MFLVYNFFYGFILCLFFTCPGIAMSPPTVGQQNDPQVQMGDSTKTIQFYKLRIGHQLDSLQKIIPKDSSQYDSLVFSLYDMYREKYVDFENHENIAEALHIALACEAVFEGELKPKEGSDLIYNIAHIYDKSKQYLEALNYYHRSIEGYESVHDVNSLDLRNDMALAYNNIGVIHAHTGFFTQRKESYLKAKALWESMDKVDKSNLISLYGNLLRLYAKYGDRKASEELITTINDKFDQWMAEDAFGKGRKDLQTDYPRELFRVDKHRLNIQYLGFSDDKLRGLAHLDSLQANFSRMGFSDQKRYSSYLLGGIYGIATLMVDRGNVKDRAEEKEYIDLGMRESIRLKDRYYEMIFHTRLVTFYEYASEDFESGLRHLDKALQIGREMDIREFNLLNIYLKRGDLLQKLGRFEEAEEMAYHGFSLLLGEPISDLYKVQRQTFAQRNDIYYVDALREVAKIYKNQYDKVGDLKHAQLAHHFYAIAADLFYEYYQKGAYNPYLDATNKEINEGLMSMHLSLGNADHEELINTVERNMSQHLWKEFEAKHLQFLNVPDSLLIEHNLLRTNLAEAKYDTTVLVAEVERLKAKLLTNEAAISSIDENYFSFLSGDPDINSLKRSLSRRQLLIRYLATGDKLFALVINSSEGRIVNLGDKKTVFDLIEKYHDQVQFIKTGAMDLSLELYDYLIKPLRLNSQNVKELIVIPDSKLNLLAFESLKDAENNRLLVEDYAVSYSYSFKLWELQQKATDHSYDNSAVAAFVPEYSKNYLASMAEGPITRGRLTHLEGALSEANFIVDKMGGEIFHKEAANKNRFMESLGQYQVFHFATHASVDPTNYENSGIYFQDGEMLSYLDLYHMHFPAEMVVLSACNTGIGELREGEGLMSLSRALTYAGVKSSVYSLWQVPDEETAVLMRAFYTFLRAGKSKEVALAMAKREFLKSQPMKQHPFYWAGFVLNGNLAPLPQTEGEGLFRKYAGYLILVLLIVAIGIFTYQKIKAHKNH